MIPHETIEAVAACKAAGGRVIAVGTIVVRSLETAVDAEGVLRAQSGWTNLYIHDGYPLRVVDGLITGFHNPEASHLDLLSAFVDPALLYTAYQEAIDREYLWHEFGDMNLIL
jgi:S-adenosylmethionine:tRNA ribosyltransferase-isomerase